MNEVFTKMNSERIELTDGYVLLPDSFNGIVLQRETEKIRTKKDKTEEKYTHNSIRSKINRRVKRHCFKSRR